MYRVALPFVLCLALATVNGDRVYVALMIFLGAVACAGLMLWRHAKKRNEPKRAIDLLEAA